MKVSVLMTRMHSCLASLIKFVSLRSIINGKNTATDTVERISAIQISINFLVPSTAALLQRQIKVLN